MTFAAAKTSVVGRVGVIRNDFLMPRYLPNYLSPSWSMSIITTRENKIPVMFPEDVKFKNFEGRPEPIMCPVLIPFWDMANHKNGEISTFLYPEIDAVVSSAMEDFKAGEQIFIFYGKRTNAEALIHNG